MKYTYDLNKNGVLKLIADEADKVKIAELSFEGNYFTTNAECEALEQLIANSELDWVSSEEIMALTDAPILGIRNENNEVIYAWAFMDYQVRSFLEDLLEKGEAIFIS